MQIKVQWSKRYLAAIRALAEQLEHIIDGKQARTSPNKPYWFFKNTTEAQIHCIMWQQLIDANSDLAKFLSLPNLQVTSV